MQIAIIGAGALGSLLGGLLARSGHPVLLYNSSNAAHIQATQEHGLVIETPEGEYRLAVPAASRVADLGGADLAILCVKAYSVQTVLDQVGLFLKSVPWVLSLQNGYGFEEAIVRVVSHEKFLRGVTSLGATLLGPGRVRWAGTGVTYLGRWSGQPIPSLEEIVDAFNRAGLETASVANIHERVWRKLVINAAINPLTALFGVPNGELLRDADLRAIMRAMACECVAVAGQRGLPLAEAEMIDRVEEVCRRTSENISSMLQDVRRGKPTEIEFINGAFVREALSQGLRTPLNLLMLKLIQSTSRASNSSAVTR
jgi:2-dehydropantoate 2-reductase